MRPRRGREQWRRFVRAWQDSGVTADEFAAAHDLHPSTLRWWASQLRDERDGADDVVCAPTGLVELVAPGAESRWSPARTEDRDGAAASPLRLAVGGRVGMVFEDLPPVVWLAELVHALEGARR